MPPSAYVVLRAEHPEMTFDELTAELNRRTWQRGGTPHGLAGCDLIRFARADGLTVEADALEAAYATTGGNQPHAVTQATEALCRAHEQRAAA